MSIQNEGKFFFFHSSLKFCFNGRRFCELFNSDVLRSHILYTYIMCFFINLLNSCVLHSDNREETKRLKAITCKSI